jgi:two-component system, OmpR family, phosphate regulon sensor histidine kinase PhoR
VRRRIFVKLLAAFVLVIAAAVVPLGFAIAHVRGQALGMGLPAHTLLALVSGLALLVALALAWLVARWMGRRLQRIVLFADRVAAGDLTARIWDDSGDEIGQVAAALDKTARQFETGFAALQSSQRQLETLLNSMQDAVIAVGPDSRVQWANRSMDRLAPQRARLQAPVVETVRDPDFLRAVREAREEGKPFTARAASILPGRTFDVMAAPMPGGGAVAVLRDLTETERVEKTRRDFIANVSHELRTPLTSIQGYTETLLDNGENQQAREFLEVIRKNAMRMARLTEDLLTLARVESGEQRFDIQPLLPAEVLQEAVQSLREMARAQGVELQVVDEAGQTPVRADREAIYQVFSNLVDNALKYGATGGRVVLGARLQQHRVEFYVQDFGPGVASEHLPRLFERFYRVDKARSRESGGTGLGLAIAKHIVLAHGGTIRAESELNHGSTFLFTLPAVG